SRAISRMVRTSFASADRTVSQFMSAAFHRRRVGEESQHGADDADSGDGDAGLLGTENIDPVRRLKDAEQGEARVEGERFPTFEHENLHGERRVHGRARTPVRAADDSTGGAMNRRRKGAETGGKDQASFSDSAPVASR